MKSPMTFKEKPNWGFRWFVLIICLPVGLLAIFSTHNTFELTTLLGLSLIFSIMAEWLHRLNVRNCGTYFISKKEISYKSGIRRWRQSLSAYKNIVWSENISVGRNSYHTEVLAWKFTIKHINNQQYSVVFDSKLLPRKNKPLAHKLWRQLCSELNLSAEVDVGHSVLVTEYGIAKKNERKSQAPAAKQNKSGIVVKSKKNIEKVIILKRSFFIVLINLIVTSIMVLLFFQNIQEQSLSKLWLNYKILLFGVFGLWSFFFVWSFSTFQFSQRQHYLVIESLFFGFRYYTQLIQWDDIEEVCIYNRSLVVAHLIIGTKEGRSIQFNAIKKYHALNVRDYIVECLQ